MSKKETASILQVREAFVSRGDTQVLRNFSWSVRRGEHWAVLGPNGSGKSTLVQVLQGWLWPQSGNVSVLGRNFGSDDVDELRRRVAWVGNEVEPEFPPHQTVFDLAASGLVGTLGIQFERPDASRLGAARQALRLLRLTHLAKRSFNQLSQGQRRLAVIARALTMRPDLLLLDEPASGLDPVARERFLESIQILLHPDSQPLVIYITHHLDEILPGFTHVLLLREGRVVAAGPRKKVLTPALLKKTFSARFTLSTRNGRLWAYLQPAN
jgi:iron complex transport system ATP-binding protein